MSFKSPYRMFPWLRTSIESALGNIPLLPFDFDLGALTFTPSMAKRAGGTFAAAPIVQGKWDGTGTGDTLLTQANTTIFDRFRDIVDVYQGTISFWITPEWDGDDGLDHQIYEPGSTFYIRKMSGSTLRLQWGDGTATYRIQVEVSAWTAGTTYHIVCRWDEKKSLDGTNFESDGTWVHNYNGNMIKQTGRCIPCEFPGFLIHQFDSFVKKNSQYTCSFQRLAKPNKYVDDANI